MFSAAVGAEAPQAGKTLRANGKSPPHRQSCRLGGEGVGANDHPLLDVKMLQPMRDQIAKIRAML